MAGKKRKKKKGSKNWIILLAIVIIAVLIYIPLQPQEPAIEPAKNVTTETGGIKDQDLVEINFVLSLEDGTVVDTNNEELAEEWNIGNYVKGPFRFVVGESSKVKGFDDAIMGLKEGDKKTLTIEPSEKVLFVENTRKELLSRQQAISRHQKFSKSNYDSLFGKPPIIGDAVFNENLVFKYQIVNITEKNVWAKIIINTGDEVTLEGNHWKSKALDVGERMITFVHNPAENLTYDTRFGTAKITIEDRTIYVNHEPELGKVLTQSVDIGEAFSPVIDFEITEITNTTFLLRRTNYLAQEKLTLDVEVLSVQELS